MYQHILISTDGSEVARKGVDHGLALAKGLGARATILTVIERVSAYVGGDFALAASAYDAYAAAREDAAEKILAEASEVARGMGMDVNRICLLDVLPADAIIETAKTRGCDLIAMSSHGRRGVRRMLLGSVTAEVLANSHVPVLVVR